MIVKNRWKPDTCGCILEYEFDSETPQEERKYTVVSSSACQTHGHLSEDKDACFAEVQIENRAKNVALGHVFEATPEEHKITTIKDGVEYKDFKQQPRWSFDDQRVLTITVPFADDTLKQEMRDLLQQKAVEKPYDFSDLEAEVAQDHVDGVAEKIGSVRIV